MPIDLGYINYYFLLMKEFYKIVLCLIVVFLVCNFSLAQEKSNFIKLNQTFAGSSKIVYDNLGYAWILSPDGLSKYDGYNFDLAPFKQIFGNDFTRDRLFEIEKDKLGNFWISSFKGELTKIDMNERYFSFKDQLKYNNKPVQITSIKSEGNNVWFGSADGILYKHDLNTSKIDSITILPNLNNSEVGIRSIAFTSQEEIWLSTFNGEIFNYSLRKNKVEKINDFLKNSIQEIRLVDDKKGRLWIASELDGLFSYDPTKEKSFKQYGKIEGKSPYLKYPMFIAIFCDNSGIIWAGTDGDGLYRINPENEELTILKHDESNKFSISNNTITNINEDSHGNIWVIEKKGQINILPNSNNNIKYYNGLESDTPTKVLSILKSTKEGSLWIGTDGKGLNRVFPNNTKLQYDTTKKGMHFFEGKYIQSLVEDAIGNIWIATYQRGLWHYDINFKTFTKINTLDSSGSNSSDIRQLFKDSKNRIWVASGLSISVFSTNKELLATYDYNTNGLFGRISMAICEDNNGNIWLGVNPGRLFKFNEDLKNLKNSYFTNFNYFKKRSGDSQNYNIHELNPDTNGNLWVLTASGILIKYNIPNNKFESFSGKENFKDINISSVLFENSNSLWLSSSNGIHNYDLNTDVLKSYYQTDGLQSKIFIKRSSFIDANGAFYFGGSEGVNSFFPAEMEKKETVAKLYINNIEILNKPAKLIIGDQFKNSIEHVKKIKLNSNQSSFSFQFSAIDNLVNSNYHYSYRLKGFEEDWVIANSARIASYTNIPFGNYVFEVRAGSKKGIWDIEAKKIEIFIKAPRWLSSWAFAIYAMIGLFLAYGFTRWLHLKRKFVKEEWQNQKEKELYALKMNFFAKMSHEIQTPLTLILGPIEDMMNRAGIAGNQLLKQRLLIINNNAKRLSRIAMELMTVRNKELGKLRVFASKNELIKHLKCIALSFTEQARFKNIDFIQEYPEKEIKIWYDIDKIEHIIYNLLSNAFKFTPKEGTITLKVTEVLKEDSVELSIIDSGPGIPKEELEDIFKLFYQADLGKHSRGFGIGLALTKELISLHKGNINVVSSPESGTTFSVKLSTSEAIFSESEKLIVDSSSKLSKQSLDLNFDILGSEFNLKSKPSSRKRFTLLIVEDNIEMQIFLRDVLIKNYNVLIAENGFEGVKLAELNIPDLILSDIRMPKMDGIEMCTILQKNIKTSHIPIVLLTAKNTTKAKIKGLKSGAIEFIQKPFNFYELLLKINNIIAAKEKVILNFKTEIASSPKDSIEKSKDELFLEELVNELNDQLDNTDFKLEELSQSLNMSYSVIYRKCQDITGMNLVEFVRVIRLKKAAFLIIKQGYNIAEAAFMVGYKDSKYFTKCFKEEFGKTPNHLKREAKKIGVEKIFKKYNILQTS